MTKYGNSKRDKFLKSLSLFPSLEDPNNDLTLRCKFNFSYYDPSQDAGQNFCDWTHQQLCDLLEKIRYYTKKPLDFWRNERIGRKGLRVLAVYGAFPKRSDFEQPKYIPHQAQWSRFRLGFKVRLIGFVIPTELHKKPHPKTGELFDKNTFYVVFLDKNHRFYISESN